MADEEELRKILVLLRQRTGVDFQHYRRGTVHRRILRRMLLHRQDTRKDYLAHLRINPAELDALYDELLIGVTNFFRDPEVFAYLQGEGFARLIEEHVPDTPIRAWVAGCAGGEEAYSLAIALLEVLGDARLSAPDSDLRHGSERRIGLESARRPLSGDHQRRRVAGAARGASS